MITTLTRSGRPRRPAAPLSDPPSHLSNVQILRGIGAVMVLVYHIGNELSDLGLTGAVPDLGAGSAGVDIFFVVSGFIMVHSTAGAFGRPGAPGLFLARRIVRLVPLYWLATTAFAVALVWQAGRDGAPAQAWRWFAASYAFLFYPNGDGGDFPVYAQGWTLNFEMFFYLCFAAVLPLRRNVALWVLGTGFAVLTALGQLVALPWPANRWADTTIIEFVLGLGVAQAYAAGLRVPLPGALALATAGFATFALTIGSVDAWLPCRGLVWGPPALAVVAGATLYRPRRSGPIRRAFEALGDASYALYLVHYAFFAGLGAVLDRLVTIPEIPALPYGAVCFFGAIALAFATHHIVERPLTRALNRAFDLPCRWRELTAYSRHPD